MGGGVDFSLVFTLHNEVSLKFEGPEKFFLLFLFFKTSPSLQESKERKRGVREKSRDFSTLNVVAKTCSIHWLIENISS